MKSKSLAVKSDLFRVGFVVNTQKSIWAPVQSLRGLGYHWDLKDNLLTVPEDKIDKLLVSFDNALSQSSLPAWQLASVTGSIISNMLVFHNVCKLMTKSLHRALDRREGWESRVGLDHAARRCAFASKTAHLRDPELRNLAEGLPLRAAKVKAPSTTKRYSRAFQKFRGWSACFEEFVCFSSDELSVALYLEFLLQQSFPYSVLESACYGINWVHNLYGFPSPCDSKLVRNVLEAAKRELVKPVIKRELVTPEMISSIRNRFAGPNANLSDLHLAAICVTAYSAFLRYNELASLCCCDFSFL
ncbi:hypothetical protein P5673_032380 [Acropora cervicornis]|uniref:Uncharacterized protein n=1 Tax=Acropora cervicornis TaxID=6130 RepID=A0AAD9PRY5_ACRCE|nr:hypothetical protein P5673_032380 [Acropora cervicornis]